MNLGNSIYGLFLNINILIAVIITIIMIIIINFLVNIPLQPKRRPLYLKPQSVPRCKHFSSLL